VAQAGGVVNDLGPQVVAARLAGANQVAVQISFNAAQSLRTLDADAAAGVGWSAIGNGADTRVNATSAQLTGTDTLLLTFSSPLPANAKLYYGYGYGRLAGSDGAGQGNAVYDNAGMPIWVGARGLAVNGVAVISDVVLRDTSGAVAVWELNGAGITEAAVLANPGNGWTLVPAAGFSNDQRDDLLFQHTDGRLAQWWMDGASIAASAFLLNPGTQWKAVEGGDFNNDGRGDILFRHDNGDIGRVERLMRRHGVRGLVAQRRRVQTTDSRHAFPVAPNLLERKFSATSSPNQVWLADLTYIATGEGWLYMAAIMDLHTRKIVGWAMRDHLRAELAISALLMAIQRQRPGAGLIQHSDRGIQYACGDYQTALTEAGIIPSMSRRANPLDNAPMESFFHTLKTELVHHRTYATRDEARRDLFSYVEGFYNRQRLHSALDYRTPDQAERQAANVA
jgi:transposase InsO family protein